MREVNVQEFTNQNINPIKVLSFVEITVLVFNNSISVYNLKMELLVRQEHQFSCYDAITDPMRKEELEVHLICRGKQADQQIWVI
jgi:hypothetical protein